MPTSKSWTATRKPDASLVAATSPRHPLMPKAKSLQHITRSYYYDSAGNPVPNGYMVRFSRRGKRYQAFFSDGRYGGQKKALEAAKAHRDEMEPKMRPLTPVERANVKLASNTSGTVGVRWSKKVILKGKKKYTFEFAIASWSGVGGRHSKSFSADKYGREQAWKMAVKARKAGLAELAKSLKH